MSQNQNRKVERKESTKTTRSKGTLKKQSIKQNEIESQLEKSSKLSLKERISTAPVSSSVGNLCRYECLKCKKVFDSRKSLNCHLKKTKHALASKEVLDNSLVKIVVHQCFICFKKVLCIKITIKEHVRKHNICSIEEYVDKTKATLGYQKIRCQMVDLHLKLNGRYEVTEDMGNLCKYKCESCDFSCHKWSLMRRHIYVKGHETEALAILKYLKTAFFHRCRMCEQLILCDTEVAKNHLRKKHEITFNKYRVGFLKLNTNFYQEYQTKLKTALLGIPSVNSKHSFVLNVDSLPEDKTTRDMGNLSFFRCAICCKSDMSFDGLNSHYRKCHQMKTPVLKYDSKLVIEARYHKCYICSRLVMCDNHILGSHVRGHKMSFSKYRKDFVLRMGFRVFPSFHEYAKNNYSFQVVQRSNHTAEDIEEQDGLILPHMLSSESDASDEET